MAQVPSQCLPGDAAAPGGPGYGVDAPRSPRAPTQPAHIYPVHTDGRERLVTWKCHLALASGSRVKLVTHWPGTKPVHGGVCEAFPAHLPDTQTGCRLPQQWK